MEEEGSIYSLSKWFLASPRSQVKGAKGAKESRLLGEAKTAGQASPRSLAKGSSF